MHRSAIRKQQQANPTLLGPNAIPYAEASRMVRASFPSFDETIQAILRRDDLSDDTAAYFQNLLQKNRKRQKRLGALRAPADWAHRHPRLLGVACGVLILLLFFAATPVGRTWAKEAYTYVVTVFQNYILLSDPADPSDLVDVQIDDDFDFARFTSDPNSICFSMGFPKEDKYYDENNWYKSYDSVASLMADSALAPVVLPETYADLDAAEVFCVSGMYQVALQYTLHDGACVVIHYEPYASGDVVSTLRDVTEYPALDCTVTLLGSVDDDDYTFSAIGAYGDGWLSVGVDDAALGADVIAHLQTTP